MYSVLSVSPVIIDDMVYPGHDYATNISVSARTGNKRMNATCSITGDLAEITSLEWRGYDFSPVKTKTNTISLEAPTTEGYYASIITINVSNANKGCCNGQNEQEINVTFNLNVTSHSSQLNLTIFECGTSDAIADANVTFNGVTYETDSNGNFKSPWVALGAYAVNVSKYRYEDNSSTFTLSYGMNNETICLVAQPYGNLTVSPTSISSTIDAGESENHILTLSNTEDSNDVDNITLTASVNWIHLGETSISSISANDYTQVGLTIGPISTAGTYNGEVQVNSSNGGNVSVSLAVTVESVSAGPSPAWIVDTRVFEEVEEEEVEEVEEEEVITPSIAELIKKSSFSVDIPHIIELAEGSAVTIHVGVNNIGQVDLENVWIRTYELPDCISMIITPKLYNYIPVGVERLFIIEMLANENCAVNILNFTIVSDYLSTINLVEVRIIPKVTVSVRKRLLDELLRIVEITNNLHEGILKIMESGLSAEEADELLTEVEDKINVVQQLIDNKDYSVAIDTISELKNGVKEVNSEITLVYERERIKYMSILWFNSVATIFMLIFTFAAVVVVLMRRGQEVSRRLIRRAMRRAERGVRKPEHAEVLHDKPAIEVRPRRRVKSGSVLHVIRGVSVGERVLLVEVKSSYLKKTSKGFILNLTDKTGSIHGLFKEKVEGSVLVEGKVGVDEKGRKYISIKRIRK